MQRLKRLWGANVAARRKALHLTQQQLATACGVTQQTISQIERGLIAPSDRLKLQLAQHLEEPGHRLFPLELGATLTGAPPS